MGNTVPTWALIGTNYKKINMIGSLCKQPIDTKSWLIRCMDYVSQFHVLKTMFGTQCLAMSVTRYWSPNFIPSLTSKSHLNDTVRNSQYDRKMSNLMLCASSSLFYFFGYYFSFKDRASNKEWNTYILSNAKIGKEKIPSQQSQAASLMQRLMLRGLLNKVQIL